MKRSLIITFAAIVAVFAAVNISAGRHDKKNAPVEQNIESAKITLTAPPMKRQEALEQKTKDALKEKLKIAYFFSSSYKKADYVMHYCVYKSEVNLQTGIDSVVAKLKDNNLKYETKENIVGQYSAILLEGTFEKEGKKFGIKEQLIKNKSDFWQVMTIYPYSDKNNKAAERFIKSISFGSSSADIK